MRILIKNLRFPFSHYRTLNLEPNATSEQIKESYYRLAKESHPDTGNSEQDFVKIK
jgi:curved DNA-binding protein CbpA